MPLLDLYIFVQKKNSVPSMNATVFDWLVPNYDMGMDKEKELIILSLDIFSSRKWLQFCSLETALFFIAWLTKKKWSFYFI